MSKLSAKKYNTVTDSKGGLVLTQELIRAMGVKTGDEFAAWKQGEDFMLVFPKNIRGKRKIPKHALWGKVEPALPEILIALPKPAKAAKVKKPKAQRAKHAEEMI